MRFVASHPFHKEREMDGARSFLTPSVLAEALTARANKEGVRGNGRPSCLLISHKSEESFGIASAYQSGATGSSWNTGGGPLRLERWITSRYGSACGS